jgi:hypothetical protein
MAMEKNIWLTSKDLMDRWGINAPSLWYYIRRKGLLAHPITQDGKMREKVYTVPNAWTWVQNVERGNQPLKEPSSLDDIIQSLNKLVFHFEEIAKFEKTHRIGIEPKTQNDKITDNRFERSGDTWNISYNGKDTTINNSKGIYDIACLLSNQFHGTEALSLFNAIENPEIDFRDSKLLNKMSQEQLKELNLRKDTLGSRTKVSLSSETDKARYRKLLKELEMEIVDARKNGDTILLKELEQEKQDLIQEVFNKEGKSGEQEEQARKAVTLRIRTAIRNIKQKHQLLGDHLFQSIKTGKVCVYQPEQETDWDIKL